MYFIFYHEKLIFEFRNTRYAQKKDVSASKFRHMKIKFHYLRKLIKDGWCALVKIGTKVQTAGLCTKILPIGVVAEHSKTVLGLRLEQSLCVYNPYCDWGVVSADQVVCTAQGPYHTWCTAQESDALIYWLDNSDYYTIG